MGIDYGTKRVGVALTDESGSMAFPHDVFPNDEKLLSIIEALVEEKKVGEIVVGHSLGRDGKDNKVQADINEFIGDMTLRVPVPMHLEPEQYSTQEALRLQERNPKTDASAAAIILNAYLSRKKNNV